MKMKALSCVLGILLFVVGFAGCSKKASSSPAVPLPPPAPAPTASLLANTVSVESGSDRAVLPILLDYDSYSVRDNQKQRMDPDAQFLK